MQDPLEHDGVAVKIAHLLDRERGDGGEVLLELTSSASEPEESTRESAEGGVGSNMRGSLRNVTVDG